MSASITIIQARSQDLEKGGGYFEIVRKVQTTLTRIFIVLESVSHGLSGYSDEISRKFEIEIFWPFWIENLNFENENWELRMVFWPKSEIQTIFSPKIRCSPKKKKKQKKKRSSPKLRVIFWPKSEIQTIFSPKIRCSPKKKKKKKKVFTKIETDFSAGFVTFRLVGGGCIPNWSRIIRNRGWFFGQNRYF